ncbi:hypothetical protein CAPTEDRAFT_216608 [Capitella teleta]|uniref:Uncharacterized protein n=1 Tax=Capitella teleta TaxID=283909 RepID=R7U6K4_CAPTE|nr:hypothetical protein CAPTEDRAFT_216608 [Capitella teleta]|eukprot:ELU01970.1 hypothetical protein CAPTEDRAFT_216608 [Capitella teleta]
MFTSDLTNTDVVQSRNSSWHFINNGVNSFHGDSIPPFRQILTKLIQILLCPTWLRVVSRKTLDILHGYGKLPKLLVHPRRIEIWAGHTSQVTIHVCATALGSCHPAGQLKTATSLKATFCHIGHSGFGVVIAQHQGSK